MIFESGPWKKRLLKLAEQLSRYTKQNARGDKAYEGIEKDIFISCYIVRKLVEAAKLSQSTLNHNFRVLSFSPTGKNVTKMNFHDFDELFDLDTSHPSEMGLMFLMNQVIHSYIFILGFNSKGRLNSFFVSSDYERNKSLYCIAIKDHIKFLNIAGHDYPNMSYAVFDETQKDYKVWQEMIVNNKQKTAFERHAQKHLNKLVGHHFRKSK